MFSGTKFILGAAIALQSVGHVFGQEACVTTSNVNWYSCGPPRFFGCDVALLSFAIRWDKTCPSTNAMVTIDFAGPIISEATVIGENDSGSWGEDVSGDVSDDLTSVTFYVSDQEINDIWFEEFGIAYFSITVDNCDTAFTWSDNFFELSYVDDEQNIIDMSGVENPDDIFGPDNGTCDEDDSDDDVSYSFSWDWSDDWSDDYTSTFVSGE